MKLAWKRWQDWANVVMGAWLFIAPWALGTSADLNSSWNAWIVGLLIVCVALWALASPDSQAAEWTNVVLGIWVFVAPWVLGFAGLAAAAWNAWSVGVVVAALAIWALAQVSQLRSQPQAR